MNELIPLRMAMLNAARAYSKLVCSAINVKTTNERWIFEEGEIVDYTNTDMCSDKNLTMGELAALNS
jgi:hypothetical protein